VRLTAIPRGAAAYMPGWWPDGDDPDGCAIETRNHDASFGLARAAFRDKRRKSEGRRVPTSVRWPSLSGIAMMYRFI